MLLRTPKSTEHIRGHIIIFFLVFKDMPWFETVSHRPLIVDAFKTELFFRLTASINKTLLPLSHSFSTVAQTSTAYLLKYNELDLDASNLLSA
jgi:hypothetical protein